MVICEMHQTIKVSV